MFEISLRQHAQTTDDAKLLNSPVSSSKRVTPKAHMSTFSSQALMSWAAMVPLLTSSTGGS